MTTPFHNPCTQCGCGTFRILQDPSKPEGDPSMKQLVCTGCGRHTKPYNWNECNPVKPNPSK